MKKKDIIKDLEENIYCRIQRSPIHGVGVFAIRGIPKGTNPFRTLTEVDVVAIPKNEIMEDKKIPEPVKEMVTAFYAVQNGNIYCDARSFNEINISYFLNHSPTPNLDVEERGEETHFRTNRNIRAGEELMTNYSKFSEE